MKKRGAKPKYAWDSWFQLGKFTARRGVDYLCSPASFVQQLRNAASRRGLIVHVVERGPALEFTVSQRKETTNA